MLNNTLIYDSQIYLCIHTCPCDLKWPLSRYDLYKLSLAEQSHKCSHRGHSLYVCVLVAHLNTMVHVPYVTIRGQASVTRPCYLCREAETCYGQGELKDILRVRVCLLVCGRERDGEKQYLCVPAYVSVCSTLCSCVTVDMCL